MIICHKCGYTNSDAHVNCSNCKINLEWASNNLPPFDQSVQIENGSVADELTKINVRIDTILEEGEKSREFTIGMKVSRLDIVINLFLLLLGGGSSSNHEPWLVVLTNRRVIFAWGNPSAFPPDWIQRVKDVGAVPLSYVYEISFKKLFLGTILIIKFTNKKLYFWLSPSDASSPPWDHRAQYLANLWWGDQSYLFL